MTERSPLDHFGVLVGVTLVIAGIALTAAQLLGLRVVGLGWPLLVIVPGVLFLLAAFSVPRGRGISYLAVPGMMILATGVVFQAQTVTGDWQSWSYAWALIAPTALGLGLLIAGARERSRVVRVVGASLLGAGALLFVLAEWFFVRILGVGGQGLGWAFGLVMPAVFVLLGIFVITWGIRRAR